MGVRNGGVDLMVVNVEDSSYLVEMANRYQVQPCVIVAAALDIMKGTDDLYPEAIQMAVRARNIRRGGDESQDETENLGGLRYR